MAKFGADRVAILDAVLAIGLVLIIDQYQSVLASIALLCFALIGAIVTGYNRFTGGVGGSNLFLALLIVWSSIRILIASITIRSNRNAANQ